MARNGSGTYTAPANSVNPAVATTTIDASDFNDFVDDIETALTESVARDGQTTTTAVVPFASGIKADTIVENASNVGVTIDGVLLKDSTIIFEGATADAFETTVTVTDPTADRTWTLPDATDTAVGKATTDTLTNKTLTSPVVTTPALSADSVDAITEIAAALKTGADANLVTGTAGTNGDVAMWNGDGDIVDGGITGTPATQAEQETGTNTTAAVTPGRQHFNPSALKAWASWTCVTTTAFLGSPSARYGFTSTIDDNGTGDTGLNFVTAQSQAHYPAVADGMITEGTPNVARSARVYDTLVGSVEVLSHDGASAADLGLNSVLVGGDL